VPLWLVRRADARNLATTCRLLASQAVSLWALRNICPECGFLFEDGHVTGCILDGVEAAEVPEGWSPKG